MHAGSRHARGGDAGDASGPDASSDGTGTDGGDDDYYVRGSTPTSGALYRVAR